MKQLIAILVVLAASSLLFASTPVVPNTTLAAETSNNTAAASTFQSQSNGNLGATNISKVSIKSLMYPGFNGKIYAHLMPWFGGTNHMNVGYESNDATQVAKQVNDMISRGIDGTIVDWYGPNNSRADGVMKLVRAESEKHSGFQFAVMEDVGALKACAATAGCDITGQMIKDLTYAYNTYEGSAAYIRYNGRPVVFYFGVEKYSIDWARVTSSVPGKPVFVQRNSGAFSNAYMAGAYAWVNVNTSDPSDEGMTYLGNFYSTGVNHVGDLAYGVVYKGFNDKLALWNANRVMNQNCGKTYLDTFAQIAKYYSSNRQLWAVQLGTWNDYEEATELETGIDNCLSISASASGAKVNWSVSGNQSTLDHYTVFISTDGTNLMTVGNVPVSQTSYDFSQYALAAGSYKVFVKAVGKSSIRNHMSSAVTMSVLSGTSQTTTGATTGVSILSPAPSSTVSGSVKFSATAKSPNPITSMRLYVDSVSKYVTSTATLTTTATLSVGTHAVTIQAWDSKGNIYKSSLKFAVK